MYKTLVIEKCYKHSSYHNCPNILFKIVNVSSLKIKISIFFGSPRAVYTDISIYSFQKQYISAIHR